MKTADLTGAALDWAVAKAIGEYKPTPVPNYSTDWAQGGPIIEREGISIEYAADPEKWCACIMADQEVYGPTALIAAMRCYVASKLGDEVEIPEELK
jgi:hypothetical protein